MVEKRGRPKSLDRDTGKSNQIHIALGEELTDLIMDYYIERMREERNLQYAFSTAAKELMLAGLEMWQKQKREER